MTRIKICGLKRPEDIETINTYRPDFCGFIINFPKSPRNISLQKLRELVKGLDRENIKAAAVLVDQPAEMAADILNEGLADLVQLHGSEDEDYMERLKRLTDKPVIKAFRIAERASLAKALESSADYILLDQGQGGGRAFDWSLLEGAAALKERKWFLAGGLGPENICEAIKKYRPYAVDLSSSLETEGFKDAEKIKKVIELVRSMENE